MARGLLPALFLAVLLGLAPPAAGQGGVVASGEQARAASGARQTDAPLGVGDVGVGLLSEDAARAYRRSSARLTASQAASRAAAQRQEEVTTAEFKRGALIGGAAGAAAGALIGAVLGGDRNSRVETAIPVALAGLSVGAPAGVYLRTGQSSRYLWGTVGAAGAVAAGTALYFVETR